MKKRGIIITIIALTILGGICTYVYVEAHGETEEIEGLFVERGRDIIYAKVHDIRESI